MAKTWTVNEAYNAIKANDKAGIADFGKRFPLATAALARAGENSGLDILMGAMPDRVTMRILEMSLKDGVEVTEDGDAEEVMNAPVEKKPAKKSEKPAPAKKEKAAKPKKAEKPVEDDAEDEVEAEDNAQDYSKMSAVELFKLCKSRKIKVEPKQKSSVYIKALEAEDAKAKAVEDDSDDDWSEDEEEEKPAKKSAPAKGKAKKSAPAEDDDDSDDWDI